MNIDWARTPKGTTHYVIHGGMPRWYKWVNNRRHLYYWDNIDGWCTSSYVSPEQIARDVGNSAVYARPAETNVGQVTAQDFLNKAKGHLGDRASSYDAPGGERSMAKTVAAFNAITGKNLSEEEGWLFMEVLKQVRSLQGAYKADSYEDLAGYAALRGECASRTRGAK